MKEPELTYWAFHRTLFVTTYHWIAYLRKFHAKIPVCLEKVAIGLLTISTSTMKLFAKSLVLSHQPQEEKVIQRLHIQLSHPCSGHCWANCSILYRHVRRICLRQALWPPPHLILWEISYHRRVKWQISKPTLWIMTMFMTLTFDLPPWALKAF